MDPKGLGLRTVIFTSTVSIGLMLFVSWLPKLSLAPSRPQQLLGHSKAWWQCG